MKLRRPGSGLRGAATLGWTLVLLALLAVIDSRPQDNPGSPILILADTANFGLYTPEILKTEGFNEFLVQSLADSSVNESYLARFDVVVLAETALSADRAEMLTRYVRDGGSLIAFRPDRKLAALFGLADARDTVSEGYVKIRTDVGPGKGFLRDILQFHGKADQYDLEGAAAIATLYRDESRPVGRPAVSSFNFGKGLAIAFTYNLPGSIVLTRQGDSRFAGLEEDGIKGIRAGDMFTHGWINPSKNALNQADEQMRLLSRLIEEAASRNKPSPRLWYFPGLNRSLVLLTSDGEDSTEADFDRQFSDVKSKGVRMTLYLKGTYVPAAKVKQWVADGFEISAHPDDTREAGDPAYEHMNSVLSSTVEAFERDYGLKISTVRNHWIVWCGKNPDGTRELAAQAAIEAGHGVRFDCNYYHYDRESNQGSFLGPAGNFTGSGLPMKFADSRGNVLDIYGSVTQIPDEQWGRGRLYSSFKPILDGSLDGEEYSYIILNLHTDRWGSWSRPEGMRIIDYANRRRVPVWTAKRTLEFIEARAAANFENIVWKDNRLSFRLNAPASGQALTVMVPRNHSGCAIQAITRNGQFQEYTPRMIKGVEYALITTTSAPCSFVAAYAPNRP